MVSHISEPISLYQLGLGLQNDVAEVYFHSYFKHRSSEGRPGESIACPSLPDRDLCYLISDMTFPVMCRWFFGKFPNEYL